MTEDREKEQEMIAGDELIVAREALPGDADVGTLFHLRLAGDSEEPLICALLIREMGPLEALCEVLAVQGTDDAGTSE